MDLSHDERTPAPVTFIPAVRRPPPLEDSAWVTTPSPSLPTTAVVLPSARLSSPPAHVFDKEKWLPPLLDRSILLTETIEHFSFWPLVNCVGPSVQHRPPWPPPVQGELQHRPAQLKMQSNDIQLRPIPWPSFGSGSCFVRNTNIWHNGLLLSYGGESSRCQFLLLHTL